MKRQIRSNRIAWFSTAVTLAMVLLLLPIWAAAQSSPTVGNYTLVSTTRVTRTHSNFTYRARLTNPLADGLTGVQATLTSRSTATVVIDGSLSFGNVAQGGTATSLDTFTIRQDRTLPFDATSLVWSVGVQLGGAPNTLADDATIDLPPVGVDKTQIQNGVIMTRLVLRLSPDATVGQVNLALAQVEGRIVSMLPGFLTMTISVPLRSKVEDLIAITQMLGKLPGISSASLARVPIPKELPPGTDLFNVNHLLPTRFPAAWNARALLTGCEANRVPVLVLDYFGTAEPNGFRGQIPIFETPEGTSESTTHGYDITTTVAALFDEKPPTGANPFSNCLKIVGVDSGLLDWFGTFGKVVSNFPQGKFILNLSMGYTDDVCAGAPCSPAEFVAGVTRPIERARDALDWKELTFSRRQDFLVTASAGNEADKPGTPIYPGLGTAAFDSGINVAAKADPFFGFVQDEAFWSFPTNPLEFPPITASDLEVTELRNQVTVRGMDGVVANNVLIVGSTNGGDTIDATFDDLKESAFSDRFPDVKAVGQNVILLGEGAAQGTSFSAPQVAGLASYLWLLSPDLRNQPIQVTMQAILANTRTTARAGAVIDAYATVLSLDAAATSCSSPCVRLAILDVTGDGLFDEADLGFFLFNYFDSTTGLPVTPTDKDYTQFDLNGDGFTGGSRPERFDLDRVGSTQYGQTRYDASVTQTIEGQTVSFNENALTDLQILCYYAYSDLYQGDPDAQNPLDGKCTDVSVSVSPGGVTLAPGATQQFGAAVLGASNVNVTWTATGVNNRITPTGLYTAGSTPGSFSVTATSVADPAKTGTATVTIVRPSGTVAGVSARRRVQANAFAGAACTQSGNIVTCQDSDPRDTGETSALGPFSGSESAHATIGPTDLGQSASGDASALQVSDITSSAGRLTISARGDGAASGTATGSACTDVPPAPSTRACGFGGSRGQLRVGFSVTGGAVQYSLSGSASQSGGDTGTAENAVRIRFLGFTAAGTVTVVDYSTQSGGSPTGSGTLEPGTYTFELESNIFADASMTAALAAFNVSLIVA